MQEHALVVVVMVAEGDLQHVLPAGSTTAARARGVHGHAVVQLAEALLLDAHAVEEATVGALNSWVVGRRVPLLLQHHLLGQLAHDRLGR